jgi:recombination protein RecT
MSNDNGQAIQRNPVSGLQTFLSARSKNLAQYVAGRIKPDVLIRLALWEFSQNEWLRKCSVESIYASLIASAQLGLEPGAVKGEAYLVPFRGKCQLIPGYRGLIKLALRSKAVKSVYAHVVYEQDEFSIELGSDPSVTHRPFIDGDRGGIRGAYAVAKLESGAIDIEWMGLEELEKIRQGAAATRGGKDSPAYAEHEGEMYRKAPIRRLAKRLPLGDDFFNAVAVDEAVEAGKEPPRLHLDAQEAEVIDEQPQPVNGVRSRVAQARQEAEAQ